MRASWVKESVSVGGTGDLTLGGALSGFIAFNTAFGTDAYFHYVIEDGNDREIGRGHLSASDTLVRDCPLATLVSGSFDDTSPSAIDVSTSAVVYTSPTHISEQPSGRRLPRRMVTLGASFLATGIYQTGGPPPTTFGNTAAAWWCWMQALLGHPFEHVCNAAVSGHTAQQIMTKLQYIEQFMPCTILLDGGHNNIMISGQGDVASAVAGMTEVMDYLHARGNSVILVPTGPLEASYTGGEGYSVTNAAQLLQLNAWLARKAQDLGFIFIDSYEAAMDASTSGGVAISGTTSDGWHPNPWGAYLVGKLVADRLAGQVASPYPLVTSQVDDKNVTNGNANQIVPNPLHTTTTGGTAGTGATGTVAGSRIAGRYGGGGATAVCSVPARADGFGYDQRMVVTSSANNDAFRVYTYDFAADVANSDILEIAAAVKAASLTALKSMYLYAGFTVGGTAYALYDFYPLATGFLSSVDYDIMLKIPRWQVPASGSITAAAISLIVQFSAAGGGTFDIGRITCRKIGTYAPATLLTNYTT